MLLFLTMCTHAGLCGSTHGEGARGPEVLGPLELQVWELNSGPVRAVGTPAS